MIKSSVIIPVYNTKEYLDECIQSVLSQTQKETEIIIVDDGSTDGSREIIEEYENEYENIIAIYQSNQKLGAARNVGVKVASGKYIYFLDSDDYIETDLLEKCYYESEKEKLDFLCFDAEGFINVGNGRASYLDEYNRRNLGITNDILSGKEFWKLYYKKGGVFSCAPLVYIKKEFLEENHLYFQVGVFYEDNEWIARMFICAERVKYYPEKLYYRRYREGSIMKSAYSFQHLTSCISIFWKLLDIYINLKDLEEKNIIGDIYKAIIFRYKNIVKEINSYSENITVQLELFIQMAWQKKEKLYKLGNSLYIHILLLLNFINEKKDVKDKNIKEAVSFFNMELQKELSKSYKLGDKISIAIYGTGKMCNEIFDWYERNEIPINANIKFIVSTAVCDTFKGYPLCEIEEMKDMEFDHIIIASTKYADEMLERLRINNITARQCVVTYGNLNYY